jgi:hypothetical protein
MYWLFLFHQIDRWWPRRKPFSKPETPVCTTSLLCLWPTLIEAGGCGILWLGGSELCRSLENLTLHKGSLHTGLSLMLDLGPQINYRDLTLVANNCQLTRNDGCDTGLVKRKPGAATDWRRNFRWESLTEGSLQRLLWWLLLQKVQKKRQVQVKVEASRRSASQLLRLFPYISTFQWCPRILEQTHCNLISAGKWPLHHV